MAENAAQGSRVVLDRERLVREALTLLDEVGLDDLSMRRLAERLGVTAAALYWYVRDKNELLGLLADAISAEMPLPNPSRPWRSEVEALGRGARRVARAHRDAARILVATLPTGPHRLRAIDALLELLIRGGFSPADAADIAYVLNVYGVGFMLDEALGPQPVQPGSSSYASQSGADTSLSGLTQARLIIERGAVNLTIRADAELPTLYHVTFEGHPPEVEAHEGTVRMRQRHGRRSSCDLTLSGAIAWEIHIEGGAARLTADVSALQLSSLHITGGVSQTGLRLPQPEGTIPVRIDGGVNKLRVERPSTTAIRLYAHRPSSHLTLDGLRLNAVGGGTDWTSPGYVSASDRYNVELGGAASEVSISAAEHEPAAPAGENTSLDLQMRNWFAAQSAHNYPNLVALADQLTHPDQDRRFEIGLQIMLDGLERRLAMSGQQLQPDVDTDSDTDPDGE